MLDESETEMARESLVLSHDHGHPANWCIQQSLSDSQMPQFGVWAEVVAIAASQWGVVTRRQLLGCGASEQQISRWIAKGLLHRLHRGVYAVGHPAIAFEGQLTAALFFAGPGATLSHEIAAWWWGLEERRPTFIDISLNRRLKARDRVRFHHRRRFDRTYHRRLPVTTPAQTFVDIAAGMGHDRLRFLLAEAEYRRLLELTQLEEAMRRGQHGSAALRKAVAHHLPQLARTRSELERRFLLLCESARLPLPEPNVYFKGYLVDAMWREQRLAVELDGLDGHRTPAQLERNHQRDLTLRAAGFATRRYTWHQVTGRAAEVEADVLGGFSEGLGGFSEAGAALPEALRAADARARPVGQARA